MIQVAQVAHVAAKPKVPNGALMLTPLLLHRPGVPATKLEVERRIGCVSLYIRFEITTVASNHRTQRRWYQPPSELAGPGSLLNRTPAAFLTRSLGTRFRVLIGNARMLQFRASAPPAV